jgi:hypothetical protein
MLILAAACAAAAALVPYVLTAQATFAAATCAFAGMIAAFVVAARSRPGPRAVTAAVLILVNIVLAMRAILTPR